MRKARGYRDGVQQGCGCGRARADGQSGHRQGRVGCARLMGARVCVYARNTDRHPSKGSHSMRTQHGNGCAGYNRVAAWQAVLQANTDENTGVEKQKQ